MIWYIIEYACAAFIGLTGAICIHWARWQWRRWRAIRDKRGTANVWLGWTFGLYHVAFAILKAINTTLSLML